MVDTSTLKASVGSWAPGRFIMSLHVYFLVESNPIVHFCGQKSDLHSDISAVNRGEFDSIVKVICLFLNYFKLSILS